MSRLGPALLVVALSIGTAASGAAAAQVDDAIMSLDEYPTAKSRALATSYRRELGKLFEHISHCLPWVAVQNGGIGFRRPLWAEGDDRYLSVWIFVDQKDEGSFGAVSQERRVSAMFSRYGVGLLRWMAAIEGITRDTSLRGFSVVLSWPKPGSGRRGTPLTSETLALFVDTATLVAFLSEGLRANDFVNRARLSVFDGKQDLGRLPIEVWEDPFVRTYQPQDYRRPKDLQC